MIQNEVITSHKKNVEIEWIWNDLEEKEDCEELSKVRRTSTFLNNRHLNRTSTNKKTPVLRLLSRRSASSASSWSNSRLRMTST